MQVSFFSRSVSLTRELNHTMKWKKKRKSGPLDINDPRPSKKISMDGVQKKLSLSESENCEYYPSFSSQRELVRPY